MAKLNLSVTWKLVLAYSSILVVSLTITGIYLYVQASRAAIAQARIVMDQNVLQMKESIEEKVSLIENLSQLTVSDSKLQTFLGSAFINEPYQYEEYKFIIAPFIDNMMRQNPYIQSMRIYMTNSTIPELYDSFYHLKRIDKEDWVSAFMADSLKRSEWRGLHDGAFLYVAPYRNEPGEVYSFAEKIRSFKYLDTVGILEIEVKQDVLFDVLNQPVSGELGDVFIVDAKGEIVSANLPELYKRNLDLLKLSQVPLDISYNEILEVRDRATIVIASPIGGTGLSIIGLFPVERFNEEVTNSLKTILLVLLGALVLLSIIVYLITNALLGRLKRLVKAMKQVRDGSLTVSVPVTGNDEFSQISMNFNHMTSQIHDLVETVYKTQLMEKDAELRALESQVNPHFLYNTLATISWVARKSGSTEIVNIANKLAKFYRLVLNKGRTEILIRDEIAMVKAYLDIQKFRFEDTFDVVYEIDESIFPYYTAKNVLQPIVENALVHGIEPKRGHGTIILKAGMDGDRIYYQIIDDGVGISPQQIERIITGQVEATSGSGYAMKNITDRLNAYYSDQYEFRIASRPGIGTSITILFGKEKLAA
jgi:two-component system, sensor histidine kinase YesM